MNDTGNFVIVDGISRKVWESFRFPTDTIRPTQVMERSGEINSKISETNFSIGRYQLTLLPNGNLILRKRDIPSGILYNVYYSSDTSDDSNTTNSGSQLIFDETGYMYISNTTTNHSPCSKSVDTNLARFTYQELVEATGGFKDELGKGAFGIVYKGVIGVKTVAMKKQNRAFQDGETEFQTEVNAIAKTHHKNLVQLLGYCDDGDQWLLIYEYMSNGTLAGFLLGDVRPSWKLRSHIAVSIAKGLAYLHEECSTQVIHCDIKPQNILLDDCYNAKISDFGLAKLLMMDQSRTSTGIRGTKGYVAPEWFRSTPITVKVDVYSFGVLLLEMISCRKSVVINESDSKDVVVVLTDWAWDCYQEGRLEVFLENDLEALDDYKRLTMFVKVGLWCVQENSSMRPTMKKVIQMLEGVVEVNEPQCPFPFSVTYN
ncbi:putative protein kinase RLK-Pelle-SD-2b family [Helianthus debilis subsp. tardiflorus]